jgi:hypothetical protein
MLNPETTYLVPSSWRLDAEEAEKLSYSAYFRNKKEYYDACACNKECKFQSNLLVYCNLSQERH